MGREIANLFLSHYFTGSQIYTIHLYISAQGSNLQSILAKIVCELFFNCAFS